MKIYMINPRGGVRDIAPSQVLAMEQKGWKVLPNQYLDERGLPKQIHFYQYDDAVMGKLTTMVNNDIDDFKSPILEVEVL